MSVSADATTALKEKFPQVTDRASLDAGPDLYKKFRDKRDGCIKVVMKP